MDIDPLFKTNFLNLCSPIDILNSSAGCADINILKFALCGEFNKLSLILEAINQFSVRLATSFSCQKNSNYRYLPAMIQEFSCCANVKNNYFKIQGDIELIERSFRVNCNVIDKSKLATVAHASVFIASVADSKLFNKTTNANLYTSPLYKIIPLEAEDKYKICFNPNHAIFKEHFKKL